MRLGLLLIEAIILFILTFIYSTFKITGELTKQENESETNC